MYCPVSGEVTEINEALEDSPQIINEDAYGAGWLFKLQPSDAPEMDELMDADAYQAHVDEEDH